MSRYYSDSDDEYVNHRRRPDSVIGSGWQSPLPTPATNITPPLPASSVTRIVVDPPFGSKKCDYSIDKSQRGRLIITARRQPTLSSDHRLSNNKNHIAIQNFTIPYDADVDHLQSHTERNTNRLIIEIPRQQRSNSRAQRASYISTNTTNSRLLRSPDVERMLTSPTGGPQLIRDDTKSSKQNSGGNKKLEYRIDCHGYTADELEVFIQGRDLIVQGKTHTSTSPDPTQQRVSKKFSRKITLPTTVELSKVVSYLEHGELRIEAPLKHGVYYNDEEIIVPGPPPSSTSNRTTAELVSNLENRVTSPSPYSRPHYQQQERVSRRRDYDRSNNRRVSSPTRRVRSVEGLRYPLYVSPRELDEADEDGDNSKERNSRHRRSTDYDRRNANRKETKQQQQQQPTYRSVHSPTPNVTTNATTATMSRHYNYPSDDDNYLKF